jgi:hypothetical protein
MQNAEIKILLNREILSDPPVQQERRFSRVSTTNLQPPGYNPKYFETLPTMWAEAYTFQRAIERGDLTALKEWVSLILLDYFGVIHLRRYEESSLVQEYDPDLWPAISGTYPGPKQDSIGFVELLETNGRDEHSKVVVGAFYPGIIFFPGRNRSAWAKSENLLPYTDRNRLSWEKCCEVMLQDNYYRQNFYLYLLSIATVLELQPKRSLLQFCTQQPIFKGLPTTPTTPLTPDPIEWHRPYRFNPDDRYNEKERYLNLYPLKREREGGTTYYLITDLPVVNDWMRTAIAPGLPAPNQYERISDSKIKVRFGPQEHNIELGDNDKIVLLKDLFLDKNPYYCSMNKSELESRVGQIHRLHKQEVINNTGAFTQLKPNDVAVCLAPARSSLFKHFPEILQAPTKHVSVLDRTETGGLSWEFTLFDKSFTIPTNPTYSKALPDSSLAIWPPKVSPDWNLYVVHGTGAKKEICGRWHLIDEKGEAGNNVELNLESAADEYVNILDGGGRPNRPRALKLEDGSSSERGVLFLTGIDEEAGASHEAALAVDFGTSNSCLAFKLESAKPEPLLFELSPKMLWGKQPDFENPGFVPFKWGGRKAYFPTILLSRKNINLQGVNAQTLQARHLFTTDVPGLHKDMEQDVFDGTSNKTWDIHADLKWHPDPRYPWARPAFLGLVLLYAHAELFFRYRVKINRYVFTFPLAFGDSEKTGFHEQAKDIVKSIRGMCYRTDDRFDYDDKIDESTAIAKSVAAAANRAVLEVFVDIGGGTTDIAIRYDGDFLVLDSVRLAGKSFFIFADKNFDTISEPAGADIFKRHLGKLLDIGSEKQVGEYIQRVKNNRIDLGTFYSLAINRLNDNEFKAKEGGILQHGMGHPSYQLYRTQLFFRHILAYALLQACAVVADMKLPGQVLTSGIKLILSGNGWGLMAFAEFRRLKKGLKAEAQQILQMLMDRLLRGYNGVKGEQEKLERTCIEALKVFDVDLLNETNLSKAKTDVSVGALTNLSQKQSQMSDGEGTEPYSGITLPSVRINDSEPVRLRWCERWGADVLRKKLSLQTARLTIDSLHVSDPENYETAIDHHMDVFTRLGSSNGKDPMPPEEWHRMNGLLCDGSAYVAGNKLACSPINYFMSGILYPEDRDHISLNRLAAINKTLK